MDDLILQSYLDDFSTRFDFRSAKESLQFEYLAAHCLIAKDYQGHFNAEDLSLGDANGIDSLAIFVNDVLIESAAEVRSLIRQNLEVRFVFIQTKTSSSYDQGAVLKFTQAVRYFFSSDLKADNYALAQWHEIKDAIFKNAIKFAENPSVFLYYVTTSSGQPNELIQRTAKTETAVIEKTNLFSKVEFEFIDADHLKSIYRTLSNKITKQITFEKHTILPKIHGVKRAFIGILPCKEYLRLICDEKGNLLKNVFYDNVRDYQGENSVNREIISSITGEDFGREIFVLLNNGVTVVAKSINPVGIDFTVRDFQVVNGCQTSHVLHRNVELLSGSEFITIKLIETEDVDLTNKITKATNRQTEVKLEAFAGLQPFHKELESFYASMPADARLYYERRPGQYDFDSSIPHSKVITIPSQIKAFVSVFLEEPQKIHFYYGQLLEDYSSGHESTLFSDVHDPYPYYVSSLLAFLVGRKIRRQNPYYKKWLYHISAMIRMLVGGPFNRTRLSDAPACKKYCEKITSDLTQSFDQQFEMALKILIDLLAAGKFSNRSDRDLPQNKELTKQLMDECKSLYLRRHHSNVLPAESVSESFNGVFIGTIGQLVPEKQFGFIEYGQRRFYFKISSSSLASKMKVRFKVRKSGTEAEAYDVQAVS